MKDFKRGDVIFLVVAFLLAAVAAVASLIWWPVPPSR